MCCETRRPIALLTNSFIIFGKIKSMITHVTFSNIDMKHRGRDTGRPLYAVASYTLGHTCLLVSAAELLAILRALIQSDCHRHLTKTERIHSSVWCAVWIRKRPNSETFKTLSAEKKVDFAFRLWCQLDILASNETFTHRYVIQLTERFV